MKHFIAFFLSLSVFCFIAFGISVAVLGTQSANVTAVTSPLYEYKRLDGYYSDIEISTSAASIGVYPCDNNYTSIFVTNNMRKFISAEINGSTLVIKLDPTSYIFSDFTGFLSSLFNGSTKECIRVYVPRRTYKTLNITTTAGSTEVLDISAKYIDLDLSAGSLVYSQCENETAKQLDIHVSAGSCTIYNASTENFDIDMSAGSIDVYGLTGAGNIDVSAGSGNINMAKLNGDINIDFSAGNLELSLPDKVSAMIECDISSGEVKVDYNGIQSTLTKLSSDNPRLGIDNSLGGFRTIYVNVSAGGVDITGNIKEKEAPDIPEFPSVYSDEVTAYTSTYLYPASVDGSNGLEPIVVDPIKIDPITVKVD